MHIYCTEIHDVADAVVTKIDHPRHCAKKSSMVVVMRVLELVPLVVIHQPRNFLSRHQHDARVEVCERVSKRVDQFLCSTAMDGVTLCVCVCVCVCVSECECTRPCPG